MQRIYPYIFPAVALLFVLFLLFRWYSLRTQREGLTSLLDEGTMIEELDSTNGLTAGVDDYDMVELEGEDPAYLGEVRYEIVDGQLLFSVSASLPTPDSGFYQVWLRQDDAQRRAFMLEYAKGGYMGSASIDAGTLPLEVVVSRELSDDNLLEEVLLTGTIEAAE